MSATFFSVHLAVVKWKLVINEKCKEEFQFEFRNVVVYSNI